MADFSAAVQSARSSLETVQTAMVADSATIASHAGSTELLLPLPEDLAAASSASLSLGKPAILVGSGTGAFYIAYRIVEKLSGSGSDTPAATTTTHSTSSSSPSTSSTTTSSCVSSTVTNVFLSCPASLSGTTSCSTTSISKVSGCSVTATTVSCGLLTPTGTIQDPACEPSKVDYIVYPMDGTDADQVKTIATELSNYVSDLSQLYASNTRTFGLNFWRLPLNQSQALAVSKVTNVASVSKNCKNGCGYDPTISLVYQSDVLEQLSFISWPASTMERDATKYYFDDSSVRSVDLYVVDTGANMRHPEFDRIRGRVRWIHLPGPTPPLENDCKQHGTSMLSVAAGRTIGVAKSINPIIVRLACYEGPMAFYNCEEWIEGLGKVLDDFLFDEPRVVLIATYYPDDLTSAGWKGRLRALFEKMVEKGAVLVTGTGNEGKDQVFGLPAGFGKTINGVIAVPSLLVMGGLFPNAQRIYVGTNTDFEHGLPHAWAPGADVEVALADEGMWEFGRYTAASFGTSVAAASTAGLAAYLLGLHRTGLDNPQAIKDFIVEKSWSRKTVQGRERPGISNDVDISLEQDAMAWVP